MALFSNFLEKYNFKILEYLITIREVDFSKTDVINNSKVGRATFYKVWNNLLEEKIVVPSRKIGKIQLYKLNVEDNKVKKLIELYDSILLG